MKNQKPEERIGMSEQKTLVLNWLRSYAEECDLEFCFGCNFADLCSKLNDCSPRVISEMLEKKNEN